MPSSQVPASASFLRQPCSYTRCQMGKSTFVTIGIDLTSLQVQVSRSIPQLKTSTATSTVTGWTMFRLLRSYLTRTMSFQGTTSAWRYGICEWAALSTQPLRLRAWNATYQSYTHQMHWMTSFLWAYQVMANMWRLVVMIGLEMSSMWEPLGIVVCPV